ncbi:MAG: MarR family transcriptional regulator, partial [Anaerolineaceae bacterium]|nr:MarR family transcriptional regulator [Anaerolineaceae bacterium]
VQKDVETVFRQTEEETFGNFSLEERVLLRRFFLQMRENLLNATGEEPWK